MYLVINKCVTAVKVSNFSGHYLRNRSNLGIGVLGYIGIVQHKEHSPEVWHNPPGTPCIYQQIDNNLEFRQHVSAITSHHQARIVLCLCTMKVCTLWDPISLTSVGTAEVICWLILKESLISIIKIQGGPKVGIQYIV